MMATTPILKWKFKRRLLGLCIASAVTLFLSSIAFVINPKHTRELLSHVAAFGHLPSAITAAISVSQASIVREAWVPSSSTVAATLSAAAVAGGRMGTGSAGAGRLGLASHGANSEGGNADHLSYNPWSSDFCPLLAKGGLRVPEDSLLASIQSDMFAAGSAASAVSASAGKKASEEPKAVSTSSKHLLGVVDDGRALTSDDSRADEAHLDLMRRALLAVFLDPASGRNMGNTSGIRLVLVRTWGTPVAPGGVGNAWMWSPEVL